MYLFSRDGGFESDVRDDVLSLLSRDGIEQSGEEGQHRLQ